MEGIFKKITDFCIKNGITDDKLSVLSKQLEVSKESIIYGIKIYQQNNNKQNVLTEEEIKSIKNTIKKIETKLIEDNDKETENNLKKLYNYSIKIEFDRHEMEDLANKLECPLVVIKKCIYRYIGKYLDKEEKTWANELIDILKRYNDFIELEILNPVILKEKKKKVYKLWETEEEKMIVLEYIYNKIEKNLDKEEAKKNLASEFGVSIKRIKKCLNIYLKENKPDIKKQEQTKSSELIINYPEEKKQLYEKLLITNEAEKIIEILKKYNKTTIEIFEKGILEYRILFNKTEEELKNLKLKFIFYKNYLETINKEVIDKKMVINIINLIENGIEENGIKRDFDLIDFYNNTTIKIETILEYTKKELDQGKYKILKEFILENKDRLQSKPHEVKEIMKLNIELNCQKDKNGFPIIGTGELLTNEEKELLVEYLKKRKIPQNAKNYKLLIKKYKEGTISILKKEHKTK